MLKKIVAVFIVAMLVLLVGCQKNEQPASTAPPPSIPEDIAKTATAVLDAYMAQDWNALYDQIHVDIQSTIEKQSFIDLRTETQSHIKVKYKGYALKEHKMIKTWRNPANQELQFQDVAEVYYTVNVETPKGDKEIQNILHLAKGPEGKWSYLWVQY